MGIHLLPVSYWYVWIPGVEVLHHNTETRDLKSDPESDDPQNNKLIVNQVTDLLMFQVHNNPEECSIRQHGRTYQNKQPEFPGSKCE